MKCLFSCRNGKLFGRRRVSVKIVEERESEVVIVGGGIVGLGTAREIKKRYPKIGVTVLEKENKISSHQSGNNSGEQKVSKKKKRSLRMNLHNCTTNPITNQFILKRCHSCWNIL